MSQLGARQIDSGVFASSSQLFVIQSCPTRITRRLVCVGHVTSLADYRSTADMMAMWWYSLSVSSGPPFVFLGELLLK